MRVKVKPGTFFYDYGHDAVYFADDPAGHTVELSYRPFAFGGPADGVAIQNLTVENYACADQQARSATMARARAGRCWTARYAGTTVSGVVMPPGSSMLRDFVHHNGEMGIGAGAGSGAVVHSEIAFNVWNGTDCDWECGGAKWAQVTEWFVGQRLRARQPGRRAMGRHRLRTDALQGQPHREQSLRRHFL